MSAEIPKITAELQPDDCWGLMATSYGQKTPAGPRLFKAPPHPDIRFSGHPTPATALNDAALLQ